MRLSGCIPVAQAATPNPSDEDEAHKMSPFFVFIEQIKAERKNLTLGSLLRHPFRHTAK
jgi:hypothetical protein